MSFVDKATRGRRWLQCAAVVTLVASLAHPHSGLDSSAHAVAPTAKLAIDGDSITWDQMTTILAADRISVTLADRVADRMRRTRAGALAAIDGGQRVYGWNQALGPLKDQPLSTREQKEFQRRVLLSHAAGVGERLPDRVVRLAMVLRANSMARGAIGVRPELPQRLLAMVNAERRIPAEIDAAAGSGIWCAGAAG